MCIATITCRYSTMQIPSIAFTTFPRLMGLYLKLGEVIMTVYVSRVTAEYKMGTIPHLAETVAILPAKHVRQLDRDLADAFI